MTNGTATNSLQFLLNDQFVQVDNAAPTTTVLQYLRQQASLTGTKEGCAEGDCGACTVVVGERKGDDLELRTVNACIQFLPTLQGKSLYTVEYLRQDDGSLHPVQQALVDCHGSQCGFCTPGFVMSLWGYYVGNTSAPSKAELKNVLSGNLCRCTGYKPILEAGVRMFEPEPVIFDSAAASQQLAKLPATTTSLAYSAASKLFYAPGNLAELLALRRQHPTSTLLAGGTDVGLWVNKQFRDLGTILYTGNVAEMQTMELTSDGWLQVGAAVSLTDAYERICEWYPQLRELMLRFASLPIRNAGTLGGNVANGSPIGDSAPWLIALGGEVVLANADQSRTILVEDLYVDYMQQSRLADEVVVALRIPPPVADSEFRCWKVCKRYDSDISAVCGAVWIQLDGDQISAARVAFGGMAATSKRAPACEAALIGQPWSQATVDRAKAALGSDYSPLTDMRATADYRRQVAANLLTRFYLETRTVDPQPIAATRAFDQLETLP